MAFDEVTIRPLFLGDITPYFAPDERHFLARGAAIDGVDRLTIGDLETETLLPIDLDYTALETVRWSSDSQFLVIAACILNQYDFDLHRVDVETQAVTLLTEDGTFTDMNGCAGAGRGVCFKPYTPVRH